MTKFGKQYKDHPTPQWVIITAALLEYVFATIAAGTVMVPDAWSWWKYVVAGAGVVVGGWNKVKPYFGVDQPAENRVAEDGC